MRKLLPMVLTVVLLAVGPSASLAQTSPAAARKPVLTISFAGYSALRGQLEAVGKLAGNPRLAEQYEVLLVGMTHGRGLAGLDAARPWGFVATSDGDEATPDQFGWLGFLPAKDLSQLAALIPDPTTGRPLAPGSDGVVVMEGVGGKQMFAVQKGAWAYVAPNREALANAPADPLPLLDGMEKQYLLAVRLSVKNLPPTMRQSAMLMLELGMQAGMRRRAGEDDDEFAARRATTRKLLQGLVGFVNDLDEVLLGLSADAAGGKAALDCRLTAVAGSATAARLSAYKGFPSDFAAFALPDAAVNVNIATSLDDLDVAQAKALLTNFRAKSAHELDHARMTPEQAKAAKECLSDVLGVAEKTLDGKKLDWGLSLALKPGASALVVGGLIADGQTLDKAVRRLAAEAGQNDPALAAMLKLDAETAGDIHLHVLTYAVPNEDAARLVGKEVEMVAGMSGQRLYLAVGSGATKLLKETIAKAGGAAAAAGPLGRVSVSGKAVAEFVAAVAPSPTQAKAAAYASVLQQPAGKDHLVYAKNSLPNGVSLRIEAEEGLLKLLGTVLDFAPRGSKSSRPAESEGSPF